jgi:hypothetical protein
VIADAGYRGHSAPSTKGLRIFTSGQKWGVAVQIKREFRHRSAVGPVIGHLKEDHRMDRNYLTGQAGDATNAVLAELWHALSLTALFCDCRSPTIAHPARYRFFTDDDSLTTRTIKPGTTHLVGSTDPT